MKKISLLASSIQAALLIGAVGSFNAYAQQEAYAEEEIQVSIEEESFEEEDAVEEEEIERVEITGSRIKRLDMETASPITVIDASEMQDKGFTTAYDALKDLTQANGSVQGAESAATGSFTPNAQVVSLRGLGGNQALVLVNGRRMADYPSPYNGASNFVNLSTIPFAAIERIEVITGGASAIYGSDAISGVMNIITKKDIEDTTLSVKGGTTTEGGGDEYRFQLVTGTSGNDYSVTAAFEYAHVDPIFSKDREWMDSVDDGPAGSQYLDRGIVIVDEVAQLFGAPSQFALDIYEFPWYRDPDGKCETSGSGYEYVERLRNEGEENEATYGKYCGVDLSGTRTIQNERDSWSIYLNGSYELTDDIEMYADVLYSAQDALIRSGDHFINEEVYEYRPDGDGNLGFIEDNKDLFNGGPFDGWRYYDWHTRQRRFASHELGWRDNEIEDTSLLVNAGFKGLIFDEYDWDVTFSRSENTNDSYRDWLKEEAVYTMYFGEMDDYWGGYNGAGTHDLYAPVTADMKDQLIGTQLIKSDSYSNSVSGVITGSAFELPAGDVQWAFVAEWNKQGYDIKLDDRTQNTEGEGWYGLTGSEGGGDRSRYAVGLEMAIPVMENFELSMAGRYDEYEDDTSDVGGRFTPQVGFTYYPFEDFLVRGNWSKSFRAPDMHRVFATEAGYYTTVVDYKECRDDFESDENNDGLDFEEEIATGICSAQSIRGTSVGSKTLKEEEGTNYGFGLVWAVTGDANLSLDWYTIELEQIVQGESAQGILLDVYSCEYGTEDEKDQLGDKCDPASGSLSKVEYSQNNLGEMLIDTIHTTNINVAKTTVEGIDATADYSLITKYGDFKLKMSYSHTLGSTYQQSADSPEVDTRDLAGNFSPRSTINGSITWRMEDVAVTLSGRRVGSVPINSQPAEYYDEDSYFEGKVQRLDPYYTFNLTTAYHITEDFLLSAQVVNIFNPRPPKDESHYSWPFYNGGVYGGAAVGRKVSMEAIYTF